MDVFHKGAFAPAKLLIRHNTQLVIRSGATQLLFFASLLQTKVHGSLPWFPAQSVKLRFTIPISPLS
jgi:hypothetical protein